MRSLPRPTQPRIERRATAGAPLRPRPVGTARSAALAEGFPRPPISAAVTAARAAALVDDLQRYRAPELAQTPLDDFAAAQESGAAERAARCLEQRIRAHLTTGSIDVRLTDNRYSMISVRRETGPRYQVRLHHMFSEGDPTVMRALARYIGANDGAASRTLGEFIDRNQDLVRPCRRPTPPQLETRGVYFDLQAIFDDLNARYFAGAIRARITWGQRTGRPRRRNSIKMGSYSIEDRLIRMHRSLDRPFVPGFFVEWIVFHEMLHQVHDAVSVGGRRRFHTRAFLADEASFEHYERARAWERANLDALLTY